MISKNRFGISRKPFLYKNMFICSYKRKEFLTENFKYSTNPIFRWKLYLIKHLIVSGN